VRKPARQGSALNITAQKTAALSVRGQLDVAQGRRRYRWIPDFLINIDPEGSHHDRYHNRHHSTGFYIRRVRRMVKFLQIAHFSSWSDASRPLDTRPFIYGVSILNYARILCGVL
jgi:hypothetical protein